MIINHKPNVQRLTPLIITLGNDRLVSLTRVHEKHATTQPRALNAPHGKIGSEIHPVFHLRDSQFVKNDIKIRLSLPPQDNQGNIIKLPGILHVPGDVRKNTRLNLTSRLA